LELSALHRYRDVKQQIEHWLEAVAEIPQAAEIKISSDKAALSVQDQLRGVIKNVQDDTFKVAVVGEYSSGKSSLLNVLLRLYTPDGKRTDGLLPTAITPTTAVVTTLFYDQARSIEITLNDGEKRQVNSDQLNGFLTGPTLRRKKYPWSINTEENERIAEHIKHVRIGCVSPLLKEGVALIDTPGIGSINEYHAKITREFTAEVDAALFLVSVDPPMGEREMTFLQHIKSITDRCLFIQTKRDLGERTEHGEVVWQRREREHRSRIEEVLKRRDYPFYCVSASQAAYGLRHDDDQEFTDSGFRALETELQRFLVAERGVPRIKTWLKRAANALDQIETARRVQQEFLDAKLIESEAPIAGAEDYAQWQQIRQAVQDSLSKNQKDASDHLADKKMEFTNEVMREAQRELSLTSAQQLAEDSDRRLQMERAIVRSVQYHSSDLLTPIIDFSMKNAQKVMEEALGRDNLPKIFQQFRNFGVDLQISTVSVDFNDLVETLKFTRETRRGGIGIVDFFLGPVKTEVTEHKLDKERFTAMVEKAIEETYREVKSEMLSTLNKIGGAASDEMDRIVTATKNAADQQRRIQQQSHAECQKQLQENQRQQRRYEQHRTELNKISSSVEDLEDLN
jgi:GTPase SAR1 family protein